MAGLCNLIVAVWLVCFAVSVEGVTDQQFQELSDLVKSLQDGHRKSVSDLQLTIGQLKADNHDLHLTVGQLKADNVELSSRVQEQASMIHKLKDQLDELTGPITETINIPTDDVAQNTTIEERVALLEIQVVEIEEDVTGLDQDVNFLFEEQVIQDERLLNLEEATDQINGHLVQVDENIEGLQVTTLELDFRVTTLEENGGSDGNSSISELEERVETLEGTAADHEARITSTEGDVEDLEGSSADHETRITAAEENIQGLQTTDISLDARITALEENGGGGGSQNETIAFHSVLTSYDTIGGQATVEFNEIVLNEGNGYDSTTGVFTVPSAGNGVYYFSSYLLVDGGEAAIFDIQLNDDVICTAYGDHNTLGSDFAQAMCSAVVSVVEGDEVKLVLRGFTDTTPLYESTTYYSNGFNGFRL